MEPVQTLRGASRRKEWIKISDNLKKTCKAFEKVCSRLDYTSSFADLNWQCKRAIFVKAIESMALSGSMRYEGQLEDCKKLVQCKAVCKSWKYWIRRLTSGVEMRSNIIDIDI